jgi:NADH-quinone oxidoreductase subunit J
MDKFFYFLSFLAILAAVMVVLSRNPIHSVLYLILTFFAIAGHYILLNAQFLAIVHIIVYAGAIMVLFLFVIMFLNLNKDSEPKKSFLAKISATIASGLLFLVMVGTIKSYYMNISKEADSQIGLVSNLGKVLFDEYMLPFEISSVLFLSAMIGAVILGKKPIDKQTIN